MMVLVLVVEMPTLVGVGGVVLMVVMEQSMTVMDEVPPHSP